MDVAVGAVVSVALGSVVAVSEGCGDSVAVAVGRIAVGCAIIRRKERSTGWTTI